MDESGFPVLNGGISFSGYTSLYNVHGPAICISEGGESCGYITYMSENFWAGGHLYYLSNLENNYDEKYLYQYLKYKEKVLMSKRVGSTLPNIQRKDIQKFPIISPPKIEQVKVANFLLQLDNLILVKRKEEMVLKELKIYLLKEILCSNNTTPNIRYKSYESELNIYKLESLSNSLKSGGTPKTTDRSLYDGEINFLSISDIAGKVLLSTEKFINENAIKKSSTWVVPADTLIYTMYASPAIPFINKIPVAIPQSVIAVDINNKKADKNFIYYYLWYQKQHIMSFTMTGTQANLSGEIVKNIKCTVPEIVEQTKIGDLLSKIDDLILLRNQENQKLEQQKLYILNNLLI